MLFVFIYILIIYFIYIIFKIILIDCSNYIVVIFLLSIYNQYDEVDKWIIVENQCNISKEENRCIRKL